MNEHHYQRIDKGSKRLKISEVEREGRKQPRTEMGTYLPAYPPEMRAQAILEATDGLRNGTPTPKQVAERLGIPISTIYSWLIADPNASQARTDFFAERVGLHLVKIEGSSDPLELARAREAYRAWADIASKRDPANYGQKQEITHTVKPEFTVILKPEEKLITDE